MDESSRTDSTDESIHATSVPSTAPPIAVDIDGTLTDAKRGIDPRVLPVLRSWPAPVVVSTGKAIPYPVALCEFLAMESLVIAENGGVVLAGRTDTLHLEGDREAVDAVAEAYREQGYDLGWGAADLVNRWRETELAVSRDMPLAPLEELAADHGLTVVDTGFAYHVKSTDFDKGTGLERMAEELNLDAEAFAAVGDSENDAPTFRRAGLSVAVANADRSAKTAADHVTGASHADGFLEAIEYIGTTFTDG
jgi:phosphoglycolate phosphatase (TIGR01487 family)